MATRIKLRSDTAANWAAANPILAAGEIGLVVEGALRRAKVGDGATAWNVLDWAFEAAGGGGGAAAFADLTDKASADLPAINTPLATALSGKAATSHTHTASQISDSTAIGRAILTATDQFAARAELGAEATGNLLFTSENPAAAKFALEVGSTGDLLFQALTPAAARETLGVIRRVMASDALATSTTPVSAPDLTFPVEAGKLYRVDLNLIVQSLGTVGYQVAMTYPTNARIGQGQALALNNFTVKTPNLGLTSTTLNTNTAGNPNGVTAVSGWVYLRPTVNGNVEFSAAQQTAGTGTVGLLTGSIITVTEI